MSILNELLKDLDREEVIKEDWVDLEDYCYDLNIQSSCVYVEDMQECKIKEYWLKSWICTDTRVGLKAHYLEEKLVAVSYQSGRKCDKHFYWASVEAAVAVKTHIQFLIGGEEWKSHLSTIEGNLQLEANIQRSIQNCEEYSG